MVDQKTVPVALEKKMEAAINNYLNETPRKLRDLRQVLIPSSVRQPLSKLELANLTSIGPQNVGKIEKDFGETNSLNPSLKYLIKIAIIFDIDMNYLAGLTNTPKRLEAENKNESIDSLKESIQLHKDIIKQQERTISLLEEKVKN